MTQILLGAVSLGLLWSIMTIGVYITYRILDIADLSVEGTLPLGAAVACAMITRGGDPYLASLCALLAGCAAGLCTGILHTKLKIPALLSGILTMIALYSINLRIMGMSANKAVSVDKYHLLLSSRHIPAAILTGAIIALVLISLFYWYFGTEQGSALRATGSNPAMSRALGIDIGAMKILGLAISNGVVALSGGLMSQYQGFADINMGRGAIVIGLAAVIIGEVLGKAILGKHLNFFGTMSFVVIGGVVYYLVVVLVLWLRLNSNDLKLITAVIVALFLAVPYLREQRKTSFKRLRAKEDSHA